MRSSDVTSEHLRIVALELKLSDRASIDISPSAMFVHFQKNGSAVHVHANFDVFLSGTSYLHRGRCSHNSHFGTTTDSANLLTSS